MVVQQFYALHQFDHQQIENVDRIRSRWEALVRSDASVAFWSSSAANVDEHITVAPQSRTAHHFVSSNAFASSLAAAASEPDNLPSAVPATAVA